MKSSILLSVARSCVIGLSVVTVVFAGDYKPLTSPNEPIPRDALPDAKAIARTPSAPIPKRSAAPQHLYKTWSLFLINNPFWIRAESNENIERLYDQFEAFGEAIGRNHVSIWFWSTNRIKLNPFLGDTDIGTSKNLTVSSKLVPLNRAVDVDRSAEFCEKLNLPTSGGPYIFVTNEYPGEGRMDDLSTFLPNPPKSYYTLSLNNKSSDEIRQLLIQLADKIRADRLCDLNSRSEGYWTAWQRAFEGIRGFLASRQMTVTIKTPFGEIKIG